MRLIFILVFGLMISPYCMSATLSSLITDLRYRADETDTATSNFSDAQAKNWLNDAQERIVSLGGFIQKQVDISYALGDSLGYVLPSDFRYDAGAMYRSGRQWETMVENPNFAVDTDVYQYFIKWKNSDTALLYIKGELWIGNTIRVFYLGVATEMTSDTTECEAQDDMEPFIVEEAFSYYLESMRMFQPADQIQRKVRTDMGLTKQVKGP